MSFGLKSKFLYDSLKKEDLFLKRKYDKAILSKEYYSEQDEINKKGRKIKNLETKFNKDIITLIKHYLYKNELTPKEITKEFEIGHSTFYKWLYKYKIPTKKIKNGQTRSIENN